MKTDSHPTSTDAQSLNTVFTLLRDRRRRYALAALADREPPVSLSELAAAVATREASDADRPSDDTAGAARDATTTVAADDVAQALHHVHLPKLADAGVVDYDAAENTVTLARTGSVAPFLETVDDLA